MIKDLIIIMIIFSFKMLVKYLNNFLVDKILFLCLWMMMISLVEDFLVSKEDKKRNLQEDLLEDLVEWVWVWIWDLMMMMTFLEEDLAIWEVGLANHLVPALWEEWEVDLCQLLHPQSLSIKIILLFLNTKKFEKKKWKAINSN